MDPSQLLAQADKLVAKASSPGGFFSFLSGSLASELYEEATDLYRTAANSFKIKKQFVEAGDAFAQAAEAQKKAGNKNDFANNMVEAFKCYRLGGSDADTAARALEQAIEVFLLEGQFRRAANFQMELAETYPAAKAGEAYEKAGDWYAGDLAQALALKAYLKAADLKAEAGDYTGAVKQYQVVIAGAVGNNMAKWSLKDYYLKVVLCLLAQEDVVGAQQQIERGLAEEPLFEQTREYALCVAIIDAVREGDLQEFTDKVYEFDQFLKLDKLKTELLLTIKRKVEDEEDDLT